MPLQIIPPPISKTDFDKVLARQRPTVSKSDLDVHERFTKEFGEEGWRNWAAIPAVAKICSLLVCCAWKTWFKGSLNGKLTLFTLSFWGVSVLHFKILLQFNYFSNCKQLQVPKFLWFPLYQYVHSYSGKSEPAFLFLFLWWMSLYLSELRS